MISKLQLELIQRESTQGLEDKQHIIRHGMMQTEKDQPIDQSDQVHT